MISTSIMSLGHFAAGYFTAVAVEKHFRGIPQRAYPWLEVSSVMFALAPDADVLIAWVHGEGLHHTLPFTHSLILYLVIILPLFFLFRSRGHEVASCIVLLAVFGGLTHITLDFFSHGVMCFYPIDRRLYSIYGTAALKSFGQSTIVQPFLFLELASVVLIGHHVLGRRGFSSRVMKGITAVSFALIVVLLVCFATLKVRYGSD